MRQDEAYFEDEDLELIFIAKRLKEAQKIEALLTEAGIDYMVEPDRYRGGVLFVRELIGAFFYVAEDETEAARQVLRNGGFNFKSQVER